jgi:hypothetical protein
MATTQTFDWQSFIGEVARVGRAVSRHGFSGTFRLAAWSVSRLAYLREVHVWYRLDLQRDRSAALLPAGMSVSRVSRSQIGALAHLSTVSARAVERRMDRGAEWWLATRQGLPVFACWIFRRQTPLVAVPGGWVDLPVGTVGLDDSTCVDATRARAIAPAVWSAVAANLAEHGVQAIVTKVEETNLPYRRAIEHAGFRAVASMQVQRIGGRARVQVRSHEEVGAAFLASQFAR